MVDSINARRGAASKEEYNKKRDEYREYKDYHNKLKKCYNGAINSKYFENFDENDVKQSNLQQKYYMNMAAETALRSPMVQKHGAIIVYRNEIISKGFNYFVADYSIHAEVAAIKSVKKKYRNILSECEIYVVRIGPNRFKNTLKYSKPCFHCQNAIMKHNFKKAFYSTNYAYDMILEEIDNCVIA